MDYDLLADDDFCIAASELVCGRGKMLAYRTAGDIRILTNELRDARDRLWDRASRAAPLPSLTEEFMVDLIYNKVTIPIHLSEGWHRAGDTRRWREESRPFTDDWWPNRIYMQLVLEGVIKARGYSNARTGKMETYCFVPLSALEAWKAAKLLFFADG